MGRFEHRERNIRLRRSAGGLLACALLVFGQGSCGPSAAPVVGPDPGTDVVLEGVGGNQPPSFRFLAPIQSLILDQGSTLIIEYVDEDVDTNALVSLELDPNLAVAGDEFVLLNNCPEDSDGESTNRFQCPVGGSPGSTDRLLLDTSVVPTGKYNLVGRINDELNPEVVAVAGAGGSPILIDIVPAGLSPANAPPTVKVTAPTLNIGVGSGDRLVIEWEDADPDSNADLFILLDFNNNSTDDDFTDAANDPGLILLGRRSEDPDPGAVDAEGNPIEGQTSETPGSLVPVDLDGDGVISQLEELAPCLSANRLCKTIDISEIPIRLDGEPFFVRITATDGVNKPVHAYAPGTVRLLTFASGSIIDLGETGRTVLGAVFQGFNTGANAGSEFVRVGDYDGDGAADPLILARFGQPFSRGNVGQAYLMMGINGQRLAGTTNLNSVGVQLRGAQFAGGFGARTLTFEDGPERDTDGLTSAAVFEDLDGDGLGEFIFGMPRVRGLYDNIDPDPADNNDCVGGGYQDALPDDFSGESAEDDLGASDFSNFDLLLLESGYCFIAYTLGVLDTSGVLNPNLPGVVVDLPLVGQFDLPADVLTVVNDEGTGFRGDNALPGVRYRGSWYDFFRNPDPTTGTILVPDSRFAQTVAVIPDMTSAGLIPRKDGFDEILMSVPAGGSGGHGEGLGLGADQTSPLNRPGKIILQTGFDFTALGFTNIDLTTDSFPYIGGGSDDNICFRFTTGPTLTEIVGAINGDEFGFGSSAGDFNLDGSPDILCGAPGADRNGKFDSGILYILFGSLSFGNVNLAEDSPPRVEIHGDDGDQVGRVQSLIDDFDGGSTDDIIFGVPLHDGDFGADSGLVGIVLGGQLKTGENIFSLGEVATFALPGVIIEGDFPDQRFGTSVASAGDFNGDGLGDVVITAPGETRVVNGQVRRGVVYIVFGSDEVINRRFFSSQIGTAFLPGKVFVSPYEVGTLDEAAPTMARGIGDVDGDGFDDIMVGNPDADFVDPASPNQRRPDAGEIYLIYGSSL